MWKAFLFSWAYGYLGRLVGRIFGNDAAKREGFEELLKIAEPLVIELATKQAGNDDKRKEATERLKMVALEKGLPVFEHLLNLAVEMAVAAAKNK
jgi:uncharacterized membrane-anchored protein